jgi:DNA-binding phage protein
MSQAICLRRSVLYPLEPIGVGTPEVESLLSYFYRLAGLHCLSAGKLFEKVTAAMGWEQLRERNYHRWFNSTVHGSGNLAVRWSQALSELTSVERLDKLTLVAWRQTISQHGFSATSSRWCSQCFAQDLADGCTPYLRLAWDVRDADACPKHQSALVNVCPACTRNDTRDGLAYVVPGWCSFCGAFLGGAKGFVAAGEGDMWKSSQIGAMLAAQSALHSQPRSDAMINGVRHLIARMDVGKSAVFARRIGLSKSTVHYWLKRDGIPSLAAHLRIASQTGVSLLELLTGDIDESWSRTLVSPQLATLFPDCQKRTSSQARDIEKIKEQLDMFRKADVPISLSDAARRLSMNRRELYRLVNEEALAIGKRWKQHRERRGTDRREKDSKIVQAAVTEIEAEGKSANLRSLIHWLQKEELGRVNSPLTLLKEAKMMTAAS